MKPYKFLSFLFILLLAANCEEVRISPDSVLISNVNIIDIETGEITGDQSILVEDGVISKIFKSGSVAYKATTEFNARGGYAIPGLWDLHIHLRGGDELVAENEKLLPLYTAHGVTTVRDAGGDLTNEVLEWRQQAKEGELVGPYIFTSGPKLDGVNSTWEGSLELSTKEDVTAALDSLEELGVDYVKIYDSRLSAELYIEIVRQTEERGLKVTGHMPMTVMLDDAIEAGLDGIDHLYYVLKGASSEEASVTQQVRDGEIGFWTAIRRLMETYDPEKAAVLYQKMAREGVAVVPTLYIDEVLSFLHEVDHSEDEMLKYIGEGIQQSYARRVNSAMRRDDAAKVFEAEMHQLFKDMIVPMHDAGITIMAGSDNGAYNSYVYAGVSLHEELRILVDSGLTPLEALQTSILSGRSFFEVEDRMGSIQIGYKADLVILADNPLEDIRNTRSIRFVVNQGKAHTREELDLMLSELAAKQDSTVD